MIAITHEPIDVAGLFAGLDCTGAGSVVFHLGVVKGEPEGKKSRGVSFEPGEGLEAELAEIEKMLREKFKIIDLVLVRRMGRLEIGDYILFGAVSANGRVNAFDACRQLVESCKTLKHMKKQEHFLE